MRSARPLVARAAAAAIVAAGCGSTGRTAQSPPPPAQPARPEAIRLTCDDGWTPNRRTFAARHWRRDSVRLGPLTLLNARRLATAPDAVLEELKIRTLVKPDSGATLAFGETADPAAAFSSTRTSAQARAVEFPACAAVPQELRALRDVGDRGFPLMLTLPAPGCYDLAVSAPGVAVRHALKVGVQACPAEASGG